MSRKADAPKSRKFFLKISVKELNFHMRYVINMIPSLSLYFKNLGTHLFMEHHSEAASPSLKKLEHFSSVDRFE